MTKQEFQELTQNIVLLDGATGSNLMAAGMPKGVCTEEWVLAHKDVIQNLQRAYIEAKPHGTATKREAILSTLLLLAATV